MGSSNIFLTRPFLFMTLRFSAPPSLLFCLLEPLAKSVAGFFKVSLCFGVYKIIIVKEVCYVQRVLTMTMV